MLNDSVQNEGLIEESDNNKYEPINKWDDLDIDVNILRGIYSMGFEDPSPIQRKAIRPMMAKHDIIAQAQSGTGKTAAFSIGALSQISNNSNTNYESNPRTNQTNCSCNFDHWFYDARIKNQSIGRRFFD